MSTALSGDGSGIFAGGILMGHELHSQDLDFQGDNGGVYVSDSVQGVFSSGDMQTLNNENQQLVNGGGNTTPLTSEITTLEESTYKVGRLSVEERKEKIHRYMKKRNERNFSKKIKYACRKTLADSRPRVRGRFAKNDDFGETVRPSCSNPEDEDDEVVGKEEDEMVDSSDIFAHISGVNSFKCSYPLQSWI
ncbi:CCT domain [Macleaya cordata]|uniref:CCT domain n=1 Tax=Macleaya cordata TaxID=56857 RepID=A0A200PVW8_MACCD|nr:CCT domain [Macleaya cordata]